MECPWKVAHYGGGCEEIVAIINDIFCNSIKVEDALYYLDATLLSSSGMTVMALIDVNPCKIVITADLKKKEVVVVTHLSEDRVDRENPSS